jgi:hypothetical protein
VSTELLSNSEIAELLAIAAESAKMPLQKALRRASRKALFWEDEVSSLIEQHRSTTDELSAVGPSLDRIIRRWFDNPPVCRRNAFSISSVLISYEIGQPECEIKETELLRSELYCELCTQDFRPSSFHLHQGRHCFDSVPEIL